MSARSRFGLTAAALEKTLSYGTQSAKPTCNPCREDDHGRCPTAITEHAQDGFSSTYDCACYGTDKKTHEDAVLERTAAYEARQADRDDRPYGHRGPFDEYDRWAGDDVQPYRGGWDY